MSRYENYAIKNNVFGTLSAPISSLATTIQLNSWQWARFSVNQLATLENVEDWKVKKREILKITAIAWDVLTVVRKYAPCPSSDDANTQWQVSYAFSADDTISAYIDKEHFDKIDDSINDIYDNWVNKLRTEVVSWLQIKVNAWPVLVWSWYYDFAWWTLTLTDNTTNYVEIDKDWLLVSNTSWRWSKNTKISIVVTSWWEVSSITDWRLWTVGWEIWWVNIHDLTEKTNLSADDEFIVSDSDNIWNNKKVRVSNILWYKKFVSSQNIQIWDIISIKDYNFGSSPNNIQIGKDYNTAVAQKIYGSWVNTDTIKLWLAKVWNGQNITIRIETDNEDKPSGTLVNNNATITVQATSLTTTLTEYTYNFLDNFNISDNNKCWVVISVPTLSTSNYCTIWGLDTKITQCLLYYNSDWTPALWTSSSATINYGSGNWGWLWTVTTLVYTVVFNKTIYLKSFDLSATTLTITQWADTIYSWTGATINKILEQGKQYIFTATGSWNFQRRFDLYSSVTSSITCHWYREGRDQDGWTNSVTQTFVYTDLVTTNFNVITNLTKPFIVKVDTSNIYTFDDLIWVAQQSWADGDNINTVLSWIITNSNWSLTIGKDYYYLDNNITDTVNISKNFIRLWKAINESSIDIDIKKQLYWLSSNIVPYTWLVNGAIVIKNSTATGNLIAWF